MGLATSERVARLLSPRNPTPQAYRREMHPDPDDVRLRDELEAEANRIYIDAEYTGRQHMEAGRMWQDRASGVGLVSSLVAAASSGGAGFAALLGLATAWPVVLGFIGAIAGAVRIAYRPEDQAKAHALKGAAAIAIRNDARRFMKIDLHSSVATDALADRIRLLGARYDELRSREPLHLPKWTYDKVKAQIEAGNYDYENDPLWTAGKH